MDFEYIKALGISNKFENINILNNNNFIALAFKIITDHFVGTLTYLRIYSGVKKSGDYIYNSVKKKKERLGRILLMYANSRKDIEKIDAGNIVAVLGLKYTSTGDTLCEEHDIIILEKINTPLPVMSISIEPKTRSDQEKMGLALNKLIKEDPSLKKSVDPNSSQTIISGMGELHLDIILDRLKREFNVHCSSGKPKVSYKETITGTVTQEGKYIRQSGGKGQYGHVIIKIKPNKEKKFEFINQISKGAIPKEYISSIEKGIYEHINNGIMYGYQMNGIKVILIDGSFHEVDSSEVAFKNAGSLAFRNGVKKCNIILLEPIMLVDVITPEEYLGKIIGDISSKRGIINNINDISKNKHIKADIPLSEMFGYTTILRSISKGRATYNMEFKKYNIVPKVVLKKFEKDTKK